MSIDKKNGNIIVVDTDNNRIREISNGNVSTIDVGTLTFKELCGIAIRENGNIIISDAGNNRIIELIRNDEGKTIAQSVKEEKAIETETVREAKKAEEEKLTREIESNEIETKISDATHNRISDLCNEPTLILNPIVGLLDYPLPTFKEAIDSIRKIVPEIDKLESACKQFAEIMTQEKKKILQMMKYRPLIYTPENQFHGKKVFITY